MNNINLDEKALAADVTTVIDRTIQRCRDLQEYAGRPAWEGILREELTAYLTSLLSPEQSAAQPMSEKPLTATQLAEALDCFWNAALGESHQRQAGIDTACIMAVGLSAVSIRLRELADLGDADE